MSTLAQHLNTPRGARVDHYPRGLHGPYVASPWAAARLGKRIFASRAEYHQYIRADYDPAGHHHPVAVAARIAEREVRVALENAARHRQAVWDGLDPEAPTYVQPRVEIRKRQARTNLPEGTGHGIRRCVRTPQEEYLIVVDIMAYMYPRLEETFTADIGEYVAKPEAPEYAVTQEEPEYAVKIEESDSITVLWWNPGEEEKPRIKEEDYVEVLPPVAVSTLIAVASVHYDEPTTAALLVPKEEEAVSANTLSPRATPVAIKLEASPSVHVRQEPEDEVISFGHYDTESISLHEVVSYASGFATEDIEMVDEPVDAPKVEPVEGVLPLFDAPLAHLADGVEMVEATSSMDLVEEDIAMFEVLEEEQVVLALEVKEEDVDIEFECLDNGPALTDDVPLVFIRAESPDDAVLLAGAFTIQAPPAIEDTFPVLSIKAEPSEVDLRSRAAPEPVIKEEPLDEAAQLEDDAVAMHIDPPTAPTWYDTPVLAEDFAMAQSAPARGVIPRLDLEVESPVVEPLARVSESSSEDLFVKRECIDVVIPEVDFKDAEGLYEAPEVEFKESPSQELKVEFKESASEELKLKYEEGSYEVESEQSPSVPELDCVETRSLPESDSTSSFFTASESFPRLLSPSPSEDTLPPAVAIQSPSVLAILEEFAGSPLLPSQATFDDKDLWAPSMSPSSAALPTYPTSDDLAVNIVSSPEFASNFAQAQFPSLVFRSFVDFEDEEPYYADAMSLEESCLRSDESIRSLMGFQCATPYETARDFFDGSFADLVLDDHTDTDTDSSSEDGDEVASVSSERDEDTCSRQIISSTEPPESPKEPFEELWAIAKARAETERVLKHELPQEAVTPSPQQPQTEPFEALWECAKARASTERVLQPPPQPAGVDTGRALADIDPFQSLYEEIDDLLELWAPSEPEPEPESLSVLPPACPVGGALLPDEDEEYYRTPSTINLTGAGHHNEKLAKEARETFWEMWTRPSDTDLALFFKRSDDAPSGLHIFVEEDTHRAPLPGSGEVTCSFQPLDRPLDQPLGARERLRQEQRDAFLVLWKESFEQDDL